MAKEQCCSFDSPDGPQCATSFTCTSFLGFLIPTVAQQGAEQLSVKPTLSLRALHAMDSCVDAEWTQLLHSMSFSIMGLCLESFS